MTDGHNKNEQAVVFHAINDAVVANAEPKVSLLSSLERLDPMWPWILGQ